MTESIFNDGDVGVWKDIIKGDSRVMRVRGGWVMNIYTTIMMAEGKNVKASECAVFIPEPRQWVERK